MTVAVAWKEGASGESPARSDVEERRFSAA